MEISRMDRNRRIEAGQERGREAVALQICAI
jgi:hypothetical protein